MKNVYRLLIVVLILLGVQPARATHIVGGEVTYECLGNNVYRVRIDIYQDCLTGDPSAIAQDDPAIVAIFKGTGQRVIVDSIGLNGPTLLVPPNFNNACVNNPPNTCLRRATFIKNYTLPPDPTGYTIVYQRCCRNASIVNIYNPGAVGTTLFANIPPSTITTCNSSAVFKNYPPQIICINNPLFYDHSATDKDLGDSLSYEFCSAYQGGSASDAKPTPSNTSFIAVPYVPPYSAIQPMQGFPPLQIDPKTGLITGTPNQTGRFVVTVCCNEWRQGVLINTVKREFQFVVTNCSKAVVANIPQYSEEFNTYIVQCDSKTVHFTNLSTGGFQYNWDFGVSNSTTDTSTAFEPDYTFPDTGTYAVTLAVNRGSTCPDSITRLVKVYPSFKTDFQVNGLPCPGIPKQFIDLSTSTYPPINYWSWSFGDGGSSTIQNPLHTYDTGSSYLVVLISGNAKGCRDTAVKSVSIERFRPYAGNDTIIVKGELIHFRASGGISYTWTPSTYLDNPFIATPTGFYPDTTTITYAVHIRSEGGCEGDDSLKVRVVNQAALYVPTGFTPNGDGKNDVLRPIGIGYRKMNYFRVYNRWGQQLYYTTILGQGWDGTVSGTPADIGTYFWQLSVTDRFGKEETIKGDATLVR